MLDVVIGALVEAAANPVVPMNPTIAAIEATVVKQAPTRMSVVWAGSSSRERSIWRCIRNHESRSYTGENPVSSASGAGQWLNGTWDGLKVWVKVGGRFVARHYDQAKDAPPWVQDAAFRHVYRQGDLSMWRGTHCAPSLGAY